MNATPRPWQQGTTLHTAQTRQWTRDQWEQNEAHERRCIFAHFTAEDEGRGRKLIAECKEANQATRVVNDYNALQRENTALREALLSIQKNGADWLSDEACNMLKAALARGEQRIRS